MGELGRRIVQGAPAVVEDLKRAYADEWFAHYNYRLVANALRGHYSPGVLELMRRKSAEALGRADLLAARIGELGGQLQAKLPELVGTATDKPFKLPASLCDVAGALKAVLDAERTSLRTYHALCGATAGKDEITHSLALRFLAGCVRGEEELERLIGDAAAAMDGR